MEICEKPKGIPRKSKGNPREIQGKHDFTGQAEQWDMEENPLTLPDDEIYDPDWEGNKRRRLA